MNGGKYYIVLFCNKKRKKVYEKSQKRTTITELWEEYKTQKKPRFIQLQGSQRKEERVFELALIYPNNRWLTKTYVRDSLGRNVEAKIEDNRYHIKEIIPYWREELVYDFQNKKRIKYFDLMNIILNIKEVAQIFTLNNKLFIQVDEDVKLFGNKNIKDAERLMELLREDILKKKRGNFIFVKDVSTAQRKTLYTLLVSKGFKKSELFRHYSY